MKGKRTPSTMDYAANQHPALRLLSVVIAALLLVACSDSSDSGASLCSRGAGEAERLETARALVTINADNFKSLIDYWAPDVVHKEPVLTNTGREELEEYFTAMFAGTPYGFPSDREVEIMDELHTIDAEGHMTYMATIQWSGTFNKQFFTQTGMSIVKFRPGEGCPYYQRDYLTEGDSWWNIPDLKPDVNTFRNMYISIFGLSARCFDNDGDGYPKYVSSKGCANESLDCNDFVPDINPGAMEIQGNGIDEDCNALTPINSTDPEMQSHQ